MGLSVNQTVLWLAQIKFGSGRQTRTADKVVNSHLLYQLSYAGMTTTP